VKIQWLGHACFKITTGAGITILTDPFDRTVGYPVPQVAADIVTVSHQHFDHNAVNLLTGDPQIVQSAGQHTLGNIIIQGIPSYHDPHRGAERGENLIFVIEADNLRIGHLGDLGHLLEEEQVSSIGHLDVLLVPVGGYYTIDAAEAVRVVDQIKPRFVIPMHYKTSYIEFPISPPDLFLNYYPDWEKRLEFEISSPAPSDKMKVVLLELART